MLPQVYLDTNLFKAKVYTTGVHEARFGAAPSLRKVMPSAMQAAMQEYSFSDTCLIRLGLGL